MTEPNTTKDYRTYPKGPSFGMVVAAAAVFLLLALVIALFLVHRHANKMVPHGPNSQPNSRLVIPAAPGAPSFVAL